MRRYRRTYGAAGRRTSPTGRASASAHARELWALDDDDARAARRSTACVLLAPGDPVLLGRDRETLLPDPAARKKVWAALGGMGIVPADGEPVALWRGRKKGKKLEVAVEALAKQLPQTRRSRPQPSGSPAPRLHVGRGVVSLTGRYPRPVLRSRAAPGATFADHVIRGVCGRGGMGVVYRATHIPLEREVALKVIAPEFSARPRVPRAASGASSARRRRSSTRT